MKILVTGGAGYIGSHTAVELAAAGFDVLIIDNFCNSEPFIIDRIREISGANIAFENVDCTDKAAVLDYFKRNQGIQAAIHFAAVKAVGESNEKPLMYYENNLVSLFNLIHGCEANGVKGIIFSSSATVYGQAAVWPITESSAIQPESPYGNTKHIAEDVLRDVAKATALKAICLRYFNPIGAHPSARIGELPSGIPNNLVPYVTQTAAGLRPKLSVFGNDYNTKDGTALRDYIHVIDLAKAHVAALKRMLDDKQKDGYEVFNIGTGTAYSVLEIITTFEKVNGIKLNYEIVGRRPGDVEWLCADTAFANNELGWKAELSLDEMLLSAWQWQQGVLSEGAAKNE